MKKLNQYLKLWRENTISLNRLLYSTIIAFSILGSGALAQGQTETNPSVFALGSGTTHQLDLKGIEGEIPTRNFVVKPQSVVQVKQGENLAVFTQPINQVVESVKVQDASGVITNLVPAGNNAYSLARIPTGAYILDVIVDLGSNKKGAYETILVILAQGQQPIEPTQIINRIKISDDIRIIFPPDPPDDNQTNPPDDNQTNPDPDPNPPCDPSSPECAPTQCPDGRIVPPGQSCPDDALPCDDPRRIGVVFQLNVLTVL